MFNLKIGIQTVPLNNSTGVHCNIKGNWKQTCIVSLITSIFTGLSCVMGTLFFLHNYPDLNPITNFYAKHNSPLPQPTTTLAPAITTLETITKKYKECVQNLEGSEIMFHKDNVQYTAVNKHNKNKFLEVSMFF